MKWACVLVAQVFPQWLEDMQSSGMSDMSNDDGLSQQLVRFRKGLMCCAAVRAKNRIDTPRSDGEYEPVSRGTGHPNFDFVTWEEYPQLCNGVFSLQEFLGIACKTGMGLPFGVPHEKARANKKSSDYSYSKFKSKLRRIREIFSCG